MPEVKACLWNIQNYGQDSDKYNGHNGTANALRNRFIARFCRANDIDVLMIQEVSEGEAQTALQDLQRKLNAIYPAGQKDWAYSWCGSAISGEDTDEPTSPADITYRTGARTEGYAVLWRRAQAARFTMIDGLQPIANGTGPANANLTSPLNISQRGRSTARIPIGVGRNDFGPSGGYLTNSVYPYTLNATRTGYVLRNSWSKLNYPTTSIKDPNALRWNDARRPVYIVIRVADAAQTLCPISVYHAPSNAERSSWGAFIAGLARELYVVNQADNNNVPRPNQLVSVTKGTFGGDFNLSVDQADWPDDYTYFSNALRRDDAGGANCTEVPAYTAADADRRTTVQIVRGPNHDIPINSANTNDYLRYKIDLAFFRRGQNITAQRIDLLNVLINDAARVYSQVLILTNAYLGAVEAGVTAPRQRLTVTGPQQEYTKRTRHGTLTYWRAIVSGAWGGTFINWNVTRNQLGNGRITDARRAAEYMHIFISDHLPLVVTIPF